MAEGSSLKIVLMGQSAFAEKCLEKILELGTAVTVQAVYTNMDKPERPEPVRVLAEKHNIPVHQHKSLKATPDATEEWKQYQPDLAILAFVTQFVPDDMITIPRLGTVCYHPSPLPTYRGGSALQWQLIKGETKTAVCWFWTEPAVGKNVDTGPICVMRDIPIDPTDTGASLYFNKLFPIGIETCVEVVQLCLKGDPPRVKQDESKATWDPICNDKVALVDWSAPASTTFNMLRGCDPQPGAFSMRGESKVRFFNPKLINDVSGEAGAVVAITEKTVTIACGSGGGIEVGKMKGGGAKMAAAEYATTTNLAVGDKFT